MINHKSLKISSIIVFLLLITASCFSQGSETDSIQTPFKKGRWITGLSGTVRSNSSALNAAGDRNFSTEFSLNFRNGRFVKDRWLVGLTFVANRTNTRELIQRESESLFIGPSTAFYFMKGSDGSVFVSLGLGYTRYREEIRINQANSLTQEKINGGGVGALLNLGYSYVIGDKVTFDLGLEISSIWVSADKISEPSKVRTQNNINLGGVAFSFGFSVLLDSFFF